MGKINKGILGGFSGRVGNVIGGSWKGIDYMRSEATSIADPKTAKQLEQRSKFRVAVEFAKQAVPLINIGLKQFATKRSEFNYLVSRICKDWWDDANDNINFSLVQLSSGELPPVVITSVTFASGNCIIEWSSPQGGSDDDIIYGSVYKLEDNTLNIIPPSMHLTRSNGRVVFPSDVWDSVKYIYIFCMDAVTGVCSSTFCYTYVPA